MEGVCKGVVVEPFASRSEMANGNKTGFPAPERKRPRQRRGLLSGGAGIRRTSNKKTPCPFKGKAFFSGGAGNRTRVLR